MKPKICLAILASVLFMLMAWDATIRDVLAAEPGIQKITTNQQAPPASTRLSA